MRPDRRAALLLAVVALGCGWALLQALARGDRDDRFRVAGPVADLRVEVVAGDLRIRGGDGRGVAGSGRLRYFAVAPLRSEALDGGRLDLRYACRLWTSCETSVELEAPRDAAISARTAFGDVTVEGIGGDADLRATDGVVRGRALRSGAVRVETTSGDVHLDHARPPREVTVSTSSGAVRVTVPPGDYRLEADSAAGDVALVGLEPVPSAAALISVETTSGDITIAARPATSTAPDRGP